MAQIVLTVLNFEVADNYPFEVQQRSQIIYDFENIIVDWHLLRGVPVVERHGVKYYVESPDMPNQDLTICDCLRGLGIGLGNRDPILLHPLVDDGNHNVMDILNTPVRYVMLNQIQL